MGEVRKMTPEEVEEMAAERAEVGAVGRNASVCRCGRIEHFPNITGPLNGGIVTISDCVFRCNSCDWCEGREDFD